MMPLIAIVTHIPRGYYWHTRNRTRLLSIVAVRGNGPSLLRRLAYCKELTGLGVRQLAYVSSIVGTSCLSAINQGLLILPPSRVNISDKSIFWAFLFPLNCPPEHLSTLSTVMHHSLDHHSLRVMCVVRKCPVSPYARNHDISHALG